MLHDERHRLGGAVAAFAEERAGEAIPPQPGTDANFVQQGLIFIHVQADRHDTAPLGATEEGTLVAMEGVGTVSVGIAAATRNGTKAMRSSLLSYPTIPTHRKLDVLYAPEEEDSRPGQLHVTRG